MSPSWSDRLHVFIAPGLACGWRTRPWGGVRPGQCWRFGAAAAGDEGRMGACDALREILAAAGAHAGIRVIVSNHFARYLVLPWQSVLARPDEQRAFAEHLFAETVADRASKWDIRVAQEASGRPRMASAIDHALIEALHERIEAAGSKLVSLQPYLMYAFNAARRRERLDDTWFAVLEPARVCLGLISGGVWRAVVNSRIEPACEGVAGLLQLEQARAAAEGLGASSLLLFDPDPVSHGVAVPDGIELRTATEPGLAAALAASPHRPS